MDRAFKAPECVLLQIVRASVALQGHMLMVQV